MLMLVMVVGLSSVLGGFLFGRWPVALIAPAIWAFYVLGLAQDWWAYGVGDGWQYALIVGAAAAAAGTATGVLVRRAVHRDTDEPLREAS
jgi:hypothetical protein